MDAGIPGQGSDAAHESVPFRTGTLILNAQAAAIFPENELSRLAAVKRYDILDTPPDGAFDRITAIAARRFDVPISIISIVDHDRIWFKSHHGLEVKQIGRDPGLCASAILSNKAHVLSDAPVDPRSLTNPLVAGEFGLRFYAGAPLRTSDGHNLGRFASSTKAPPRRSKPNRRSHGPRFRSHGSDGATVVGATRRFSSKAHGPRDRPSRHEQPAICLQLARDAEPGT